MYQGTICPKLSNHLYTVYSQNEQVSRPSYLFTYFFSERLGILNSWFLISGSSSLWSVKSKWYYQITRCHDLPNYHQFVFTEVWVQRTRYRSWIWRRELRKGNGHLHWIFSLIVLHSRCWVNSTCMKLGWIPSEFLSFTLWYGTDDNLEFHHHHPVLIHRPTYENPSYSHWRLSGPISK